MVPTYAPQQMTTLLFAFSPSSQAFPASGLNLPAGSPSFRLCLALVLLFGPLLALIPVLPEQLVSLEIPGRVTSLTCHPTFLVRPLSLLLQPSPRSIQASPLPERIKGLRSCCISTSSCSHTLVKTSSPLSSQTGCSFQIPE